jgi:hypothetical protein
LTIENFSYSEWRVDARGFPIELLGTAPDLETAVDVADAMGPGYIAGTWTTVTDRFRPKLLEGPSRAGFFFMLRRMVNAT